MRRAVLIGLILGILVNHASAATDPQNRFAILEFRVLHNTVLGTREIERAVYPHLGPNRTFEDVQAARVDLEKAYHDAGYSTVYVDIPEQGVDTGIIRLAVTEGRLGHVAVHGTRYFMNRRILAAVPSLEPGTVPHFPDVQKQMNALNQSSPDLSVAPVLKAGAEPGTVDAELKVKDTLPLHANVEVNDRYTADTSHTRVNLNVSYDNLFQRYQTLSLGYQTAPEDSRDARVISGTYLIPLPSLSATLALYGVKTDSDVATVGTLGVIGKGQVYGARYVIQLPSIGKYVPNFTFGVDYKNFNENVLIESSPGLQTPIKYLNWSAAYGANILYGQTTTSFTVAGDFGIRGLLNKPNEFENKRFDAKPDYIYWHLDASHVRPLVFGTEVALRLSGQYTTEPLIDNEQFAVGGVDSVRGYLEAEDLGDIGFDASAEFRSPSLKSLFGAHPREAYVYTFYDIGMVSIIDPLPKQTTRDDLQGYGVGLRISGLDGFDAGFDWAHPLTKTPYESAGSSRIHFHFRYGF